MATQTAQTKPPWDPWKFTLSGCGHQHHNAEQLAEAEVLEAMAELGEKVSDMGVILNQETDIAGFALLPVRIRNKNQPVWGKREDV